MRKMLAPLLALLVIATACGVDTTDVVVGTSVNDRPDTPVEVDDPPAAAATTPPSTTSTTPATTTSTPAAMASRVDLVQLSDAPECVALHGTLVGPDNLFGVEDDELAIGRFVEVLAAIDQEAADAMNHVATLTDAEDSETFEEIVSLLSAVDDMTYSACGLPLVTAILSVDVVTARFCEIGDSLDLDNCPTPERILASVLPCFGSTSGGLREVDIGYEAVDCDSGERVKWNSLDGLWVIAPVDNWTSIDQDLK